MAVAAATKNYAGTVRSVEGLTAEAGRTRERGHAIDDEQKLGVRCYAIVVPHPLCPVSAAGELARVGEASGKRAAPAPPGVADQIGAERHG